MLFRSLVLVALLAACSSGTDDTPDAGTTTPDAGSTAPDGGDTSAPLGSACEADTDCAGDATCLAYLPGGYCAKKGCTTDSCGEGAVCAGSNDGQGVCLRKCLFPSDCGRSGYTCLEGACWADGYVAVNPGGAAVGAACENNGACESGLCLTATRSDGSSTGYTGGSCTADCRKDDDCPANTACHKSLCRASCTTDAGCRDDYACIRGLCLRDPARVPIGAACTKTTERADCAFGTCIVDADNVPGMPGGYCSVIDDCEAATGAGCGADGECFAPTAEPDAVAFCLDRCATSADCRAGYACDTTFGVGLCLVASAPGEDVRLGAACATNADCSADGTKGYCFTGEGWPTGYCTAPGCDPATSGSCGAAGVCEFLGDAPLAFCLAACATTAQCRATDGYACNEGACFPAQ